MNALFSASPIRFAANALMPFALALGFAGCTAQTEQDDTASAPLVSNPYTLPTLAWHDVLDVTFPAGIYTNTPTYVARPFAGNYIRVSAANACSARVKSS